jgi:hypothetical protein
MRKLLPFTSIEEWLVQVNTQGLCRAKVSTRGLEVLLAMLKHLCVGSVKDRYMVHLRK